MEPSTLFDEKALSKKPPKFLILYVFNGTMKRGWVGHISLWDGLYYYSYGYNKENCPCAFRLRSSDLQDADKIAYFQSTNYGSYSRIILPVNKHLSDHIQSIREQINAWKTIEYHFSKKNCVHLIQAYLEEARYLKKIVDWIIPLYPSEFAKKTRHVGKKVIEQLVEEAAIKERDKKTTLSEKIKYSSYLKGLKIALNSTNEPGIDPLKKTIFNCKLSLSTQAHFFRIVKILAKTHYANQHPKEFSAIWLANALNICPITPNFCYQPQRFFITPHPLPAIGRGLLGIVGLILLTTIAIVIASVAMGFSLSAFAMGFALCLAAIPISLITFLVQPGKYLKKEKETAVSKIKPDNFYSTAKTHASLSLDPSKAILDNDESDNNSANEQSKSYISVAPEQSTENLSPRFVKKKEDIRATM